MWSDGRSPRAHDTAAIKVSIVAVSVWSVFCVALCPLGATAVGSSSTVNVSIRDSLPAALAITNPEDGATLESGNVKVEGTVHNVGQIMIYLDDQYYATVPLNAGVETFSSGVTVMEGRHTIRVVGMDAVTNTQVEASFGFTYVPPPKESPTQEVVNNVVEHVGGAVISAGTEMKSQVNQASTSGPMKTIADVTYNALRALDLMPVGAGESIPVTVGRLTLISTGVAMTVAPWGVTFALSRLKIIPQRILFNPHMIGRLHVIGTILFLIPFLFM